jgi:di/tricarboxylate transporter
MGLAGYRFGDDWKLGLPVLGSCFVAPVGLAPRMWSF